MYARFIRSPVGLVVAVAGLAALLLLMQLTSVLNESVQRGHQLREHQRLTGQLPAADQLRAGSRSAAVQVLTPAGL